MKRYKKHQEKIQKANEKQTDQMAKKLNLGNLTVAERKAKILAEIKEKRKSNKKEDDEWEDVDEHEREVYATTGYFDVPEEEAQISKHD